MGSEEEELIDGLISEIDRIDDYIFESSSKDIDYLLSLLQNITAFFNLIDRPLELLVVAKALLKLSMKVEMDKIKLSLGFLDPLVRIAICLLRLGYTDSVTGLFEIIKNIQGWKVTNLDVVGAYAIYLIQICSTDKA